MKTSRFVRYELIRTFRNRRFFVFTVGFPLVLYFLIAAPNRHEHDLAGSGISAPPYFMVGLAALGTMNAVVGGGARIAFERVTGWTRQLRLTPLRPRARRAGVQGEPQIWFTTESWRPAPSFASSL
jgi:ABC-2 type transport system permease protein